VRLAVENKEGRRGEERRFKMDKGSSTKEEIQGDVLQISHSPSIFVEAFNALLRCLGLGTVDHQRITQESSSTSSPKQEDGEKASEESPQYPPATRTSDPQADPPTDTSVISLPHSLTLSLSLTHTHVQLYVFLRLIKCKYIAVNLSQGE
jgi:hypothetical protein